MNPDLLNELQVLCKDAYEASRTGEIESPKLFRKYVSRFNSILRKSGGNQTISDMVREWLTAGRGIFYSSQLFAELGFVVRADKKAADMALRRLVKEGLVAECGDKRGCWRPIVNGIQPIDWVNADIAAEIPLIWPLGLERYFTLYPTNVIVCAGEKNSGKTGFMLNVVHLNPNIDIPIKYFSSEMAAQELAVRIRRFPNPELFKKADFMPLDYDALTDQIEPDAINIIDYLEVEDEFWKVASKIRKMWQKLNKGIVIVALQKDPDARYGRGKMFSSEKARVYLTMTKKENMTLEEIKNFKGKKKPDGMIIPYKFTEGIIERRVETKPDTRQGTSELRVVPLPLDPGRVS